MGKQEKPYALSTDISTDNKGDTASISRPFNTILDDFQQGKSASARSMARSEFVASMVRERRDWANQTT
jgi:hypothetical protein